MFYPFVPDSQLPALRNGLSQVRFGSFFDDPCNLVRLAELSHVSRVQAYDLASRHPREMLLDRSRDYPILLAYDVNTRHLTPAAERDGTLPVRRLVLHLAKPPLGFRRRKIVEEVRQRIPARLVPLSLLFKSFRGQQ